MTLHIQAFIDGEPVGQPRPRAFARAGRVKVYDPGTAENWKGCIALALKRYRPDVPVEGPVRVVITHYMPRPRCHYGTGRNARVLKPAAPQVYHTCKPDADNLLKAFLDVCTQIGLWRDDDQVTVCSVEKRWADGRSGAAVAIEEMTEE